MNSQRRRVEKVSIRPTLASVFVVFFGGAAGTFVRAALVIDSSDSRHLWLIGLINLLGAFGLGLLLEALSAPERTATSHRRLRLGIGTGFLGGFTTYSSLSLIVTTVALDGRLLVAIAYGMATIVLGALATVMGILLGKSLRRGGNSPSKPQQGGRV